MKSETLPSFWETYHDLPNYVKQSARKAYQIWSANPFHPSLHFKCINTEENVWSLRITRNYRAIGILENNKVTWFWVGNHEAYERFFL